MDREVIIIGAGLAGIVASLKLSFEGVYPVLIDNSLPQANGSLGGFAKFSGAKFSLPPAGMGLLNVVKSEQKLWDVIDEVCKLLEINYSRDSSTSQETSTLISTLRSYESVLFSEEKMEQLINSLTQMLSSRGIEVLSGECQKIEPREGYVTVHFNQNSSQHKLVCKTLFYAGGRLGSELLHSAGVEPTDVKGLDVGVRVEFDDPAGLVDLRKLGPDAKIIQGDCRTFCLNYPGEIFRYPFANTTIPGGVVSDQGNSSNVGILYRSENKYSLLREILENLEHLPKETIEHPYFVTGDFLGDASQVLRDLYGSQVVSALQDFGNYLNHINLIDWDIPHKIHMPLLDWHWPTFSTDNSFKTSEPSIYCLGDSSGHARGLLQAALSGWLAAEEYTCAID